MAGRIVALAFATLLASNDGVASSNAVDLEQGIALYWSGQYAETIEVLTNAQDSELRPNERVKCLKYLAFSLVAVGDNEKARSVFSELLAADPRHVLDTSLVSPKIVDQYEQSRTELVESWFHVGKASYFEKDYAATRETMSRILALDSVHSLAKEYAQLASEQQDLIEKAGALKQPPQPTPLIEVAPSVPDNPVYHLTEEMTPPVLLSSVKPVYPLSARRAGREGTVIVTVIIDSDGSVRDAKTTRSLSPELDEAALDAVRQWHYRPASMDGRAIVVYNVVELEFRHPQRPRCDSGDSD